MTNILMYKEPPVDFQLSVVGVCCYFQVENHYLFLKKAKGQRHEGRWTAPGGKVEKGEELVSAMKRELHEETGIVWNRSFAHLGKFFFRRTDCDFKMEVYHCQFGKRPDVILSDEHDELRWLTLDEALCLPLIDGADLLIKETGIWET